MFTFLEASHRLNVFGKECIQPASLPHLGTGTESGQKQQVKADDN